MLTLSSPLIINHQSVLNVHLQSPVSSVSERQVIDRRYSSEIDPGLELELPGSDFVVEAAEGNRRACQRQVWSARGRRKKSSSADSRRWMIEDIGRIDTNREALGLGNFDSFLDGHVR